jgi:hypothetical protein
MYNLKVDERFGQWSPEVSHKRITHKPIWGGALCLGETQGFRPPPKSLPNVDGLGGLGVVLEEWIFFDRERVVGLQNGKQDFVREGERCVGCGEDGKGLPQPINPSLLLDLGLIPPRPCSVPPHPSSSLLIFLGLAMASSLLLGLSLLIVLGVELGSSSSSSSSSTYSASSWWPQQASSSSSSSVSSWGPPPRRPGRRAGGLLVVILGIELGASSSSWSSASSWPPPPRRPGH